MAILPNFEICVITVCIKYIEIILTGRKKDDTL